MTPKDMELLADCKTEEEFKAVIREHGIELELEELEKLSVGSYLSDQWDAIVRVATQNLGSF